MQKSKTIEYKKFQTCISKTLYFLGILDIIESENSGGAL
nr:MAG TPA: hypothetical protein [Caudoviricetes sp.]